FVDVNELGDRAGLGDGFGRRDECVGNGDDDVARANAGSHQGKAQSIGAAVYGHRMFRVTELGERLFEIFNRGATDEACAAQYLLENGCELLFELNVWSDKI